MSHKSLAVSGIKWSFLSQGSRQVMQLVTTVVLARLLKPSDFGLLGMATIVTGFIMLFRDLGTTSAIIQKKNASDNLLSSVYWVNVGFGLIAAVILYLLSPLVAEFYHEPEVDPVLKVLSTTMFISGISSLHQAMLERDLAFNKLARLEIVSTLTGSVVGIGAAILGYGVWSLVYQTLALTLVTTVLLWAARPWRPRWVFNVPEIRSVFRYSINLVGFSIFNYFVRNADYLLIGRFLGAQDLGYYTLAYRIMLYPLQSISAIIGRVMFPLYSQLQDAPERFCRAYLKVVSAIALVTFPMMLGLLAISRPFITAMFGAQWSPAILLLIILAPVGMVQSISTTVGAIYKATGRTDWLFRWGIASGILYTLAFVIGIRWGIIGVAVAYAMSETIMSYPAFVIPFKLIGLTMKDLGRALMRPFAASIVMFGMLMVLRWMMPGDWTDKVTVSAMVVSGVVLYSGLTWLINRDDLANVLDTVGFKV